MLKLRDIIIFIAGAEFFHTLSHIVLPYLMTMPLDLKFLMFTATWNAWAIIINGIITITLLWWASKIK